MAVEAGQIVFKITGDSSGLTRSLDAAKKSVSSTGGAFASFGTKLALVAAAAVAGIATIGKSIIKAASDAEETNAKFGEVFSNIAEKANASAAALAAGYALSKTEAKDLLSYTGDILTGMGMTQAKALELSEGIAKLGADLASFKNYSGGAKGAAEALTKALLGEREQLKSLGIAITDETLTNFAASQGKVYANMTQLEKATLTYNYALKLSSNAIGDMQRTQYSFANQLRRAKANINDLEVAMGEGLLPIASLALRVFNSFASELEKSAREFSAWIKSAEGAGVVSEMIGNALGVMSAAFQLIKPVLDALSTAFDDIIANVEGFETPAETTSALTLGLAGIFQLLAVSIRATGQTVGFIITTFSNLITVIVNVGKAFYEFFRFVGGKATWDDFKKQAGQLGDSVVNIADNTKAYIADQVKNVSDVFGKTGDNAEKTALLASAAYKKMSKESRDAVYKVLTAEQDAAKKRKENTAAVAGDYKALIEQIKNVGGAASGILQGVGNVISALGQLAAATNKALIDNLDAEKKAAYESAGVVEETAVQKAEVELAEAERTKNEKTIKEKKMALDKARIDEAYDKKKAKLEYEASLRAWEFNVANAAIQMAIAPLMAFTSGLQAPWPATFIVAGIQSALAAATAGIQLAAVIAAKPKPPSFATGGIVPGSSYTGDRVTAQVNSGEMILNQQQQKNLFDTIGGGAATGQLYRVAPLDKQSFFDEIFKASQNGQLFIAGRAVMA